MDGLAEEGVCRVDAPGIPGSNDPNVDPAGARSGRGRGRSRVTEAPGTFRERFGKFVCRNFLSVEILRFTAALPPLPVSAPACFLSARISPQARVGMGGKTLSFMVGFIPNQTCNPSVQEPTFADQGAPPREGGKFPGLWRLPAKRFRPQQTEPAWGALGDDARAATLPRRSQPRLGGRQWPVRAD